MKTSALSKQVPDIGRLDREITLRVATETVDAWQQAVQTWADLATVWAAVDYATTDDGEMESGGKQTVFQVLHFTIRYRSDVTEKTKVVFESTDYDILNIEQIGRQRFLLLKAQKRT